MQVLTKFDPKLNATSLAISTGLLYCNLRSLTASSYAAIVPYPPFQPFFKDMDGKHFILAEGGVVPFLLLGQGALVGLVPVLPPLEVLCLLLKASLDDVGLVHKSGTKVM